MARVAPIGARNSLSRIAIHLTSPGTPDIYQGDELWNFTLVDPDNRRPVDYEVRSKALAELADVDEWLHNGGRPICSTIGSSCLVTQRLLAASPERSELFTQGDIAA